jgi:phage-related protein
MIMTQATDQDIREIKGAIDANSRAIEAIGKGTEANTKAIADLVASVGGLREEMRVGFTTTNGRIDTLDARLTGKIENLSSIFEERTGSLGQKLDGKEALIRNISTALINTIGGGLLLTLAKILFFGSNV